MVAMKGLKYPLFTENYSEAKVQFHRPSLNKKWHGVMPSDANKHPNIATEKLINTIKLVFNTNCVETNTKQQIINFNNIILNQNSYQYKEKLHTKNMNCDGCPYILSFL
jgi:hypothetical protein